MIEVFKDHKKYRTVRIFSKSEFFKNQLRVRVFDNKLIFEAVGIDYIWGMYLKKKRLTLLQNTGQKVITLTTP